jgi:hypothetical protein
MTPVFAVLLWLCFFHALLAGVAVGHDAALRVLACLQLQLVVRLRRVAAV